MAVISVKVPTSIKEKMKEYKEDVDWPEEIRRFITVRIEELERVRAVEKAMRLLEEIPPAVKGTAKALVREDRDSN